MTTEETQELYRHGAALVESVLGNADEADKVEQFLQQVGGMPLVVMAAFTLGQKLGAEYPVLIESLWKEDRL